MAARRGLAHGAALRGRRRVHAAATARRAKYVAGDALPAEIDGREALPMTVARSRAAECARGPPRVDALPKPTAAGREVRRGRAGAAQSFPRRQGQPLDRPRRAPPRRRSSDVHLQRASKNSGTEQGLLQPAAFSRTRSRDAALMRVRQTGLGAGSERQSALESTQYEPRTASRRQGCVTMLSQVGCRPKPQVRTSGISSSRTSPWLVCPPRPRATLPQPAGDHLPTRC